MHQAKQAPLCVERFRGVDRTFAAIVAGVFLFNFGIARAIASRAVARIDDWALVEEVVASGRTATLSPRPPPTPRLKPAQVATRPKVAAAAASPRTGGAARPAASLERLVKRSALMDILSAKGMDDALNLGSELVDGFGADALRRALKEAGKPGVPGVPGLDAGGVRRGGGAGRIRSIGELGTAGGADPSSRLEERRPGRLLPRVSFEEEDEDPGLATKGCDAKAIAATVRRNLSALQHCYEDAIKKAPTLQGKVVLRFTVGADGLASEVEVDEDTVGSPGLVRCLERRFRAWRFPAAPSPCVVSHPFVFAPVQ